MNSLNQVWHWLWVKGQIWHWIPVCFTQLHICCQYNFKVYLPNLWNYLDMELCANLTVCGPWSRGHRSNLIWNLNLPYPTSYLLTMQLIGPSSIFNKELFHIVWKYYLNDVEKMSSGSYRKWNKICPKSIHNKVSIHV